MLFWLVERADWLTLLAFSVTGVGLLCSAWMVWDCYLDLRVAHRSYPVRRMLARMHLRNEIFGFVAQGLLLSILVATVHMPAMLPGMQQFIEDDPHLLAMLVLRMVLRVGVSLMLTIGAIANLQDRQRLRSLVPEDRRHGSRVEDER